MDIYNVYTSVIVIREMVSCLYYKWNKSSGHQFITVSGDRSSGGSTGSIKPLIWRAVVVLLSACLQHFSPSVDDYMQLLCSLWGVKQSHTFKSVTTEKLQTQRPGLMLVVQLLLLHPKIAPGVISGEKHGLSVYVSRFFHIMMRCGHTFIKSMCVSALVVSLHVLYCGEPIR